MTLICRSCLFLSLVAGCAAEPAELVLRDGEVLLVGAAGDVAETELLVVYAGDASDPVAGRYRRTEEGLSWRPVFALRPGQHYRVEAPHDRLSTAWTAPRTALPPPAVVLGVYPSGDAWPANLIKLHVRFSAPMQGGDELWREVSLVEIPEDGGERPVDVAFRRLELWTPDRTAVTLLLHPGRQKRDLTFGAELGPVLVPGRAYEVRVGPLTDRSGQTTAPARKRFTAIEADRTRPDPSAWTVVSPGAGTLDPVVVRFDEAMNWGLLRTSPRVDGVETRVVPEAEERAVRLTPTRPWPRGDLRVQFATPLEDLVGNTTEMLFDHEIDAIRGPTATELVFRVD